MRKGLLVATLILSLVACTEKETKDTNLKQEASSTESNNLTSSEPKFDFAHTYDETNGKQQFSRAVTEEEKTRYFNKLLDTFDSRISGQMRFDRKLKEPVLDEAEFKIREIKIRKLLDQCIQIIGPQQMDNVSLKKIAGVYTLGALHTNDDEYLNRAQPLYLTGRMLKCVNYLYFDDCLNKRPSQLSMKQVQQNQKGSLCAPSDFTDFTTDFAYPKSNVQQSTDSIKKEKIERLYEQIYLEIKQAGLLRRIFYTYYPKSFLREHADQTGLTKFIQEKEAQAGKQLPDDQLAIEFFGSREKWIESFNQFLDQKITNQEKGK